MQLQIWYSSGEFSDSIEFPKVTYADEVMSVSYTASN